jgi:Ca2+-binding RTX toxin-like protein
MGEIAMTITRISGTQTTAVGLGARDTVIITATGRLVVDAFAIGTFDAPGASVVVDGLVRVADEVAIDISGRMTDVLIGATGTVRSHPTGTGNWIGGFNPAIRMTGVGCELTNNGRIIGEIGAEIRAAGAVVVNTGSIIARVDSEPFRSATAVRLLGDDVVLRNAGTMNATVFGVEIGSATGGVTLSNSGTITGETGVWVSSGAAATLTNAGTITSRNGTTAVLLGDGATTLVNRGTVNGAVVGGSGENDVTNFRDISGAVRLGAGADTYLSYADGRVMGAVSGGSGADSLTGGNGVDVFLGGTGGDVLRGKGGADVLTGGAGNDLLIGGGGKDRFVFAQTAGEADRISEFTVGDKIDLSATTLDSFSALIEDTALSQTTAGVVIDLSGIGGGRITLSNVMLSTLDASDFIF